MQEWLSANVPNFISKEERPLSSPNLNPVNFGIWGYLESKVSAMHHKSLEALKMKMQKKWSKMPQDVIRDSCRSFSRRLQLLIDSNRKHINCIHIHSVTIFHLCYSNVCIISQIQLFEVVMLNINHPVCFFVLFFFKQALSYYFSMVSIKNSKINVLL